MESLAAATSSIRDEAARLSRVRGPGSFGRRLHRREKSLTVLQSTKAIVDDGASLAKR
jgi:hypothetical protein